VRNLLYFFLGFALMVLCASAMASTVEHYTPPCNSGDTLKTTTSGQYLGQGNDSADLSPTNPSVRGFGTSSSAARIATCPALIPAFQTKYPASFACSDDDNVCQRENYSVSSNDGSTCVLQFTQVSSSGNSNVTKTITITTSSTVGTQYCEHIVGCNTSYAGTKYYKQAASFAGLPHSVCDVGSNCSAVRSGVAVCMGGDCQGTYTVSTNNCSGTEDTDHQGDSAAAGNQDPEKCVGEYCFSKEGGQCGYLNNKFVCLTKTPKQGCQTLADGSMVCDTAAPTPPTPSSAGNRATPATPTSTASANVQNTSTGATTGSPTYNYYNSATVAAAASAGTGVPTDTNTNTDTNGDGFGDSGTGTGEGTGDSTPPCSGASCVQGPDTGDAPPSFGGRLQTFWTNVNAAPIVSAVADIADSVPAGTCPTRDVTLWGQSFTISPSCDILDDLIAVLYVVCLAGWALVSVRIVLSA